MSINLKKGSSIDLSKDGKSLSKVFLGVNWGMITRTRSTGFLGLGKSVEQEAVDLDASCSTFDANNNLIETVYFGNLRSADGAISHSGDDTKGDSSRDNNDNEIITMNLEKLNPNVKSVVLYLNSYRGHMFDKIPYSEIRVLDEAKKEMAKYNLTDEHKFSGTTSMILAKLVKTGSNWKFTALGEPSSTTSINETVREIKSKIL